MSPAAVESMFFMGATPWHQLGKKVERALTVKEAIDEAGLNWPVRKIPLVTVPYQIPDGSTFGGQVVDHFAIIRDSDGSVLGVVGPRWEPLQNVDAFEWFNPFVKEGLCTFETAGSLCEGRKVWILAKLNRPDSEIIPGDQVAKYLLLSNSHDGSQAIRVGYTPVRVVCANTLAMAHRDQASQLLRVYHTKSTKITLELIQKAVNVANEEFEATADVYRKLAASDACQDDVRKYVHQVFYPKETLEQLSDRQKNNLSDLQDKIIANFENGIGADMSRGTWWGCYNALTEYFTHDKSFGEDDKAKLDMNLNSLWFGTTADKNKEALRIASELAQPRIQLAVPGSPTNP